MIEAERTPGFLHLLQMTGGASWLHMCIHHRETESFLSSVTGLDKLIAAAMVSEDTRSRLRVHGQGVMVLLKAMHLRADGVGHPEDMVSVRIWIDERRVITTREEDVDPILELAEDISQGRGSATPGDFLCDLIEEHLSEVSEQVEMLEDGVNLIGGLLVQHQTEAACPSMANTQTAISGFLRHLGPQRAVLQTLTTLVVPPLNINHRGRLEEHLNQLLRLLETLENLRDRIDILSDQANRIQERQLNQSSYVFAVVSTIFLPLNFVTGLFGANLLGLPFADATNGFWVLVGLCLLMSVGLVAVFRWFKWL